MGRSKTLNRKKSMKHQRPGFATLRFRGDVNVEQAVENIISDPDLMVDDPDMAEIVQSEAIRGMHTNLRQKRIIKYDHMSSLALFLTLMLLADNFAKTK